MKIALVYLALLALPACACFHTAKGEGEFPVVFQPAAPYERITFAAARATAAERMVCEAAGGEIVPSGKLQWENCVQPFSDAGKACKGESDCVGECRYEGDAERAPGSAVTGTCQVTDARFGCHTVVENGKIAHTLCVD